MGSFKTYLQENEDKLQQICDILDGLSEEEIDELGYVLYSEFFDADEEFEEEDEFEIDDVKDMVQALGAEFYDDILDLLEPEDLDLDDTEDLENVEEGVGRRMLTKNFNRKKRKFMATSKAQLRRTKVKRKQDARKTKAARKRYYRANKVKIAAYQKSRAAAIKKGKHKVKVRRAAG